MLMVDRPPYYYNFLSILSTLLVLPSSNDTQSGKRLSDPSRIQLWLSFFFPRKSTHFNDKIEEMQGMPPGPRGLAMKAFFFCGVGGALVFGCPHQAVQHP